MNNNDKITRIAYILEAGFEYFISIFVTSTMLGYILDSFGFSDAAQGIISTAATFTCAAQIFFSMFLAGRRVKRLITILHIVNQLCFVILYMLPIFNIPTGAKSIILLVLLFAGNIIGNGLTPAKSTWLMSSVDPAHRGSFTAVKEMISLAGGIAVSLIFGAVADNFRDSNGMPTTPYYIICTAALFLMTVIHTVTLIVSSEKPLPTVNQASFGKTLSRMVKNPTILKISCVPLLWYAATGISVSFHASYLREELSFTFTTIAIITTVGAICRIIFSPLLGKIADKHSFAVAMIISFLAVAIGFLFMFFTAPATRWLYLVYMSLYSFAMAGINSGIFNLVFVYVAPEERTTAFSFNSALGGIVGFFAALISGNALEKIQAAGGISLFGFNLYAQQILSLISFAVIVILIIYIKTVIIPLPQIDVNNDVSNALEEVKK